MSRISLEITANTQQQGKHSWKLQRITVTLKVELAGRLAETSTKTKSKEKSGPLRQNSSGEPFFSQHPPKKSKNESSTVIL